MSHQQLLADILRSVLQINKEFNDSTLLLGAVAEFDSMAVIAVITALEDQLGIVINDDEISAEVFESFGQLRKFIAQKQAA